MHVICSLESQKGTNCGSSKKYVNYMSKSGTDVVFDRFGNVTKSSEVIHQIDQHAKGQLGKNEARWYSPVYSFSEKEAKHVASKILQSGTIETRNINSFEDLTEEEQKLYNAKIKCLAMEFQENMALNFDKEDQEIYGKDDILWFGVIEHKRKYTGFDQEVRQGKTKQGDEKKGFNTHIHIIQSRKALNKKKSKISPMANARTKTHQGAGFDRNKFFNTIELSFDLFMNFHRQQNEKFEYYKSLAKKNQIKTKLENRQQSWPWTKSKKWENMDKAERVKLYLEIGERKKQIKTNKSDLSDDIEKTIVKGVKR